MNENVTQEFENDIGSWDWVEQVEKHVPATSAAELMEMTIEPKEFVVREILTPGLSMLGGAPKCGKSWFVLDLCVHVATGEPFLGFPVTKGSAWYISLEDTKEDLYWRLDAITDKELPNLFLSTEDDPIGNLEDGLEKHLNNFIEQKKDLNIEVYFIQDGIWTMSGDGELRLSIMATLAQEESRKISERVLAGQSISRKKGTLYGTGNILGYDRKDGTYVINPEQAFVVRKIFELYAEGFGYKTICNELVRLGCKNASGKVQWTVERIGRMLRNATYKGYICYNKSHSKNYLEQKRVNHRDEDFVYIKGDFEPIVSEDLWDRCAELRIQKSAAQRDENGNTRKFGRRAPQTVWSNLLRCSCGSAFARFLWHENEDGKKTYGYGCYRQKRSATPSYLQKHGLDDSTVCKEKSIPSWHLDLMAYIIFSSIWGKQKEAVLLACQMIEECAAEDRRSSDSISEGIKSRITRLKKQQAGLREMRSLGDITREEFQHDNLRLQQDIDSLEKQLSDIDSGEQHKESSIDMGRIKATLNQWIDISGPVIPDALIEQFILQVVVEKTDTFNWTLNLSSDPTGLIPPAEIARRQYHEKRSNGAIDTMLSNHITNPQTILAMHITEEHAREYCKMIGQKFFAKKWSNKTLIISI